MIFLGAAILDLRCLTRHSRGSRALMFQHRIGRPQNGMGFVATVRVESSSRIVATNTPKSHYDAAVHRGWNWTPIHKLA
jgi:hypothetical protein